MGRSAPRHVLLCGGLCGKGGPKGGLVWCWAPDLTRGSTYNAPVNRCPQRLGINRIQNRGCVMPLIHPSRLFLSIKAYLWSENGQKDTHPTRPRCRPLRPRRQQRPASDELWRWAADSSTAPLLAGAAAGRWVEGWRSGCRVCLYTCMVGWMRVCKDDEEGRRG